MADRLDLVTDSVKKWDATPQGGLKIPAYLTRTGVFDYHYADPSTTGGHRLVRELRHPDEVFNHDSLATLEGAPVVIGHPAMVGPDNWKQVSVGHVGEKVDRSADIYVGGTLRVQDKAAVGQVTSGELVELSCGYTCDVIEESGEYNGEKYDAVQKNIRYNHVGMGPRGWGRAGNSVALRNDGTYAYSMPINRFDDAATTVAVPAVEKQKFDELTGRFDAEKARAEGLQGKLDAANARITALEADVVAANDTARIDARVSERISLLSNAEKVIGKAPATNLSDRDVMIAVITHTDSNFKADDKTEMAYLRGRFEAVVASSVAGQASLANVNRTVTDASGSTPTNPVEVAKAKSDARSRDAWKSSK